MEGAVKRLLTMQRGAAGAMLLVLGLLLGCGAETRTSQSGKAHVNDVLVQVLESFPVQVQVVIRGELADGCTEIDAITQRFEADENTFWIDVEALRTTNEDCPEELVPFEETVALDVYGLPAGTYTVDVSGTRDTFVLDVDNAPSDAELPNPASVYCEDQGYRLEMRTGDDGGQYGVCVFPDGSECDEWAFYRGECGPGE